MTLPVRRTRIAPRIGAIPEQNGYWTAVCDVPGHEHISASCFHDEEEARNWAASQAAFYAELYERDA